MSNRCQNWNKILNLNIFFFQIYESGFFFITDKVGNFDGARAPRRSSDLAQRRLRPSPGRRGKRLDSARFSINLARGLPGAVGLVKTRRGEGPASLPTPTWRPTWSTFRPQVPRRSASAQRVLSSRFLTSVVLRKLRGKISPLYRWTPYWKYKSLLFSFRGFSLKLLVTTRWVVVKTILKKISLRRNGGNIRAENKKCVEIEWNDVRRTTKRSRGSLRPAKHCARAQIRISDANGANKGAALIKTTGICSCIEERLFASRKVGFLRAKRARLLREYEGEGEGASSPATGKSCLPIYTCVQGRPRGKT